MKTIDLRNQIGIKLRLYPDNQPHVTAQIQAMEPVKVIAPIRSSLDMLNLLLLEDVIRRGLGVCHTLVIPYLMGARSDRVMEQGDSFDLEVIARLINSCGFQNVHLYDVHSPVATDLIWNSVNHGNRELVEAYDKPDAIMIVPDHGAISKSVCYEIWNHRIIGRVICDKSRDLSNGRITLKVGSPEICEGRHCVIIDDLCDGGGTFLAIAEQIRPLSLTLIVTHGIFSKGFDQLGRKFDKIIVSDSYYGWTDFHCNKIQTVPLNYEIP